MQELIERRAALTALCEDCLQKYEGICPHPASRCVEFRTIKQLPAIEAEPVQKWIPCDTELPYGGKRVLVTTAEGNVVDAIFVLKGNQWFRNGEYFPTDRVIAWMPMPSAYEPEKEDADDS